MGIGGWADCEGMICKFSHFLEINKSFRRFLNIVYSEYIFSIKTIINGSNLTDKNKV